MIRLSSALVLALALAGCNKAGAEDQGAKPGTGTASGASAAAAQPAAAEPAAAEKPAERSGAASLPKLGKLDAVDYETLKKQLADAGWSVSGSATKSAMYAINLTLVKGDVTVRLRYYRDGGASWKKILEKDGATIHEAGNVLVGVNVEKGSADPKKLLADLVG